MKVSERIQVILAGCHTLIKPEKELIGDQAELRFFKLTKWRYSPLEKQALSPSKKLTVRMVSVFQFKSELKRMSSVVEVHKIGEGAFRKRRVLCKGAPEIIKGLLKEVPDKFDIRFRKLSSKGYRVLALAYKDLDEKVDVYDYTR